MITRATLLEICSSLSAGKTILAKCSIPVPPARFISILSHSTVCIYRTYTVVNTTTDYFIKQLNPNHIHVQTMTSISCVALPAPTHHVSLKCTLHPPQYLTCVQVLYPIIFAWAFFHEGLVTTPSIRRLAISDTCQRYYGNHLSGAKYMVGLSFRH